MDGLMAKAADFSGYITELANWLREERKDFLHTGHLLECGNGVSDALRQAYTYPEHERDFCCQALDHIEDFQTLFSFMVKSGVITEIQSRPLLTDCRIIKEETQRLIIQNSDQKTEPRI